MSIDMHCHHFTFKNGGYIHPKFIRSKRIRMYLAGIGLISWRDAFLNNLPEPERIDELYQARLIAQTQASPLDHVVALAFDGIYDARGYLDKERTIKYVSNNAVVDLMRECPKFLLGASINPLRRDWKDELDKCLESGAVLIKWLSSVMDFDPALPSIAPFYERLRETGTPILMHVGFELALPTTNGRYANVSRLETVLQSGVTVIAAHCCGGLPIPFVDMPWQLAKMRRLVEQYPNLFFDIAGMTAIHRKPRLMHALADPIIAERIVYATDYPITLQPWAFRKETRGIILPSNYYAKDMLIKGQCGMTTAMLERGYTAIGGRLAAAGVILPHPHHRCCA
jgi:predicted TIM-barrel fold metal-dependent hydrolase